ncbi:MAG: hypothetical protein E7012_03195 [Alphaproteobacteria bacterium]|nr:hypothetical protein [Alphaproteobacteria bacterium]
MKQLIFILVIMLTACTNNGVSDSTKEELKGENWISLNSQSDSVDIYFKDGESPFFDMYMFDGTPEDKIITFAFYKAGDVTRKGEVKSGCTPCRLFNITIPLDEVIEDWSKSPIITRRKDGSYHKIKIKLVNQPKF